MKISIDWLKDYIELPEDPERLQSDLTMSGLVVEGVARVCGDTVFEIEVTANRPDCLSHIGIAREISAIYQRPVRIPKPRHPVRLRKERVPYQIEIRDPDLCPRYNGLVLDGVRLGTSPPWMQKRLEACGMRPINNIVDITNYVLLEMGHPLHAFDFHLLKGGKVVVARAADGQKITTLDGIERTLDREMLLINDAEDPVAIAGVMGGLQTEISLKTSTVLLECAYFLPRSIRRTSKRLNLSTEASYRFERGVDWDGTVAAISRTAQLVIELAGGRLAGSLQDIYPECLPRVQIELSKRRAESLLGVQLEDAFVEVTLSRLNFRLRRMGKGHWLVTCPSYRADMEFEADLIEELARFYGYQNIPTTMPPSWSAGTHSPVQRFESAARRVLLGMGYSEAVNLSFSGAQELERFAVPTVDRAVIRNPLTEDTHYLRTTLAPGLVISAQRNVNHDVRRVRLFEIGKTFRTGPDALPVEGRSLGILGTGGFTECNWRQPAQDYDFFSLKGAITALLAGLRSAEADVLPGCDVAWLNPADAATLVIGGTRAGVLGSLHPSLQESYKLRQPVYLAEVDFDALCRHAFMPVRYEPLPRYPAVERDLCFLVDRSVRYGDIARGITGLGIAELQSLDLIDVYSGPGIPDGKVSLTVHLVFLDRQRTLTIDRVQGFSDNVTEFLRDSFGAQVR
ncbi:MAG: phenylalanine--tRNA ligase subunit beta [Acidobacteria bacterium]|nr:phenylalanine--tRNA ligase subunit beta [Acidobacteriota bacterium]